MGAYLSAPETAKATEAGSAAHGLRYGASSMQGWRRSQEDAHLVTTLDGAHPTAVFAVFDGHGGREVSNFAASRFAGILKNVSSFEDDLAGAMALAFHAVDDLLRDPNYLHELTVLKKDPTQEDHENSRGNSSAGPGHGGDHAHSRARVREAVSLFQKMMLFKKLHQASREDSLPAARTQEPCAYTLPPSNIEAGCTAIVACVRGGQLIVANAGDSRAVLCRAGQAVALSMDHKPMLENERKRIEAAGGWVTAQGRINGCLNLSRALGDLRYKTNLDLPPSEQMVTAEPDVYTCALTPEDEFVVLACDGIWDCMSNQEVCDFVRERLPNSAPEVICEMLLDHCISEDPRITRGVGADNMTALIVKLR